MSEQRYQSELLNVSEWHMLFQSFKGIERQQGYCKIEPRQIYDALVSLDKSRQIVEKQAAEIARLTAELEQANDGWDKEVKFVVQYQREVTRLTAELATMTVYADKLAAVFPDGMLPKDVEVLRQANHGLAAELAALRERERWIPCAERLPHLDMTVIILMQSRISNDQYVRLAYSRLDRAGNVIWIDPEDKFAWGGNVTHWRPLPQPPQEVGE